MKAKRVDDLSLLSASATLAIYAGVGVVVGIMAGLAVSWKIAPLAAWDLAASLYLVTTWRRLLKLDANQVKVYAMREDPSRIVADMVLVGASVASLAAVGVVLSDAGESGQGRVVQLALGLVSIVVSWFVIHSVYALRYAEIYYRAPGDPVDFGDTQTPGYIVFAYLAFTLGMTFQVSDTSLKVREFRAIALRHALLSYLFGAIIIAITINLIAGITK